MRINKSLIAYTPTTGAGSGSVTSVALTAPTGFTVTGSPITSSGTLAIAFATGYGIPPLMTGNAGRFLTTNGTTMSWVNIAGTDITGAALTETDDTNVTMTLGGTPATALLRSVSMSLGWAGQLAVSRGGTGAATLTGVIIGNGTSAMTSVTGGPNQILRRNSAGTAFEFYTASFLTNPMTLNYDMIYQDAGVPARLPSNITTTKQFLTSIGNGTATTSLAWASFTNADVPGAALTSTNDTNVQITLGGTPSTAVLRATSLTMGWSGQLAVGRGGTGASTLTGVLIGNGTSAVTAVVGTAGQYLRRNLANTAYEFRTLQGGDIAGSELTFTNDTNVTMSLSGTPASALLQPVTIGLGWTGTLAVSRGGIGVGTITGVMIGNGTSAVTGITGTANQILRRNAGNTAYEFWSANYMTNPMTLEGSIIYATTGGTPAELFANSTSTRKYLSQINGTAPTWEALSFPTGSGTTDFIPKWTSSTVLGNSIMVNNANGVGIDIGNPQAKFSVSNGGAQTIEMGYSASITSTYIEAINRTTGAVTKLSLYTGGNSPVSIYTNAIERFIVDGSGNVGIGNSPTYKLDVNGAIGLSGTLFAQKSGAYNVLYDGGGSTCISMSSNVDNTNAYDNNVHAFRNRGGTVGFASISSAGVVSSFDIRLPSTNYINWGGAYGADIPSITATSGANSFIDLHPSGSTSGAKMRLSNTGQLRLHGYTSTSSFSGLLQGFLGFTSTGAIVTAAVPGGVSGTQNYLAKFDSTGVAVGNSRIVDDGTNFLLNGASSVVTGLNLVGNFSSTDANGSVVNLRRSGVPTSGLDLAIIDAYGITTGSTYQRGAGIEFRASQNWTSTNAGTEIAISTTPDNTTAPADMFVFLNNGAVRFIGRTSNPLSPVAGTMYYNSSANNMRYYNGTSWITF